MHIFKITIFSIKVLFQSKLVFRRNTFSSPSLPPSPCLWLSILPIQSNTPQIFSHSNPKSLNGWHYQFISLSHMIILLPLLFIHTLFSHPLSLLPPLSPLLLPSCFFPSFSHALTSLLSPSPSATFSLKQLRFNSKATNIFISHKLRHRIKRPQLF